MTIKIFEQDEEILLFLYGREGQLAGGWRNAAGGQQSATWAAEVLKAQIGIGVRFGIEFLSPGASLWWAQIRTLPTA